MTGVMGNMQISVFHSYEATYLSNTAEIDKNLTKELLQKLKEHSVQTLSVDITCFSVKMTSSSLSVSARRSSSALRKTE